MVISQMSIDAVPYYRRLAVRLLEWACDGDDGVTRSHPRYLDVTEGRGQWGRYSSCADLAHWMLYRLGFRDPTINRVEHNGWLSQVNISRLVHLGRPPSRTGLEPGDVAIVSNKWPQGFDAHAVCVINQPSPAVLLTAEYGATGGGGCLKTQPIRGSWPNAWIGRRQIRSVIYLDELLHRALALKQTVPPDLPAELQAES